MVRDKKVAHILLYYVRGRLCLEFRCAYGGFEIVNVSLDRDLVCVAGVSTSQAINIHICLEGKILLCLKIDLKCFD